MRNKIISILLVLMTSVMLISCKDKSDTGTIVVKGIKELEQVSDSDKLSYKEVGETAVKALGNVSDEEKKVARKEAIYKAIFEKEGRELIKSIDITKEEAQLTVGKNAFPKIKKIYAVTRKDEVDIKGAVSHVDDADDKGIVTENYYVYEGDTHLDGIDLKKAFPKAIKVEEKQVTEDDNIEEAKRTIASNELVKIITNKVSKIMEEK